MGRIDGTKNDRRSLQGKTRGFPGNRGVTLVELLLALAITAVVGTAAFSVFLSSNWASRTQTEVSEAQQYARIAMDRMSRDARMAGFGLPRELTPLTFTGGTWSAPVTVTDSASGPDSVVLLGVGYHAGVLQDNATDCNEVTDSYICLDKTSSKSGKTFQELFFPSSPNFKVERRYISLDGISFYELSSTSSDHDESAGKLKLSSPGTLERDYPDGVGVYILQAIRYTIETGGSPGGCTPENPCLATEDMTALRGGGRQILAENIEEMQLACGVDADNDGRLDYSGSYDKDDFVDDGSAAAEDVIALRINLIGRSRHPDLTRSWTRAMARPQLENRNSAGDPDGYRRRVSTKVIKVRNPSQS